MLIPLQGLIDNEFESPLARSTNQPSMHALLGRAYVYVQVATTDPVALRKDFAWSASGWHYDDRGPLTAQYVFVLDSLNFCFWPTAGLEYEVRSNTRTLLQSLSFSAHTHTCPHTLTHTCALTKSHS
jgi:hypothetical protein